MIKSGAKKIEKRPKSSGPESRDFIGTKRTFPVEKKENFRKKCDKFRKKTKKNGDTQVI
jgi:hypothetical protein